MAGSEPSALPQRCGVCPSVQDTAYRRLHSGDGPSLRGAGCRPETGGEGGWSAPHENCLALNSMTSHGWQGQGLRLFPNGAASARASSVRLIVPCTSSVPVAGVAIPPQPARGPPSSTPQDWHRAAAAAAPRTLPGLSLHREPGSSPTGDTVGATTTWPSRTAGTAKARHEQDARRQPPQHPGLGSRRSSGLMMRR